MFTPSVVAEVSIANQNQNFKGITWQLKQVPYMIIFVAGVSLARVIGYTEPPTPFHRYQAKDLEYSESESELHRNDMATRTNP